MTTLETGRNQEETDSEYALRIAVSSLEHKLDHLDDQLHSITRFLAKFEPFLDRYAPLIETYADPGKGVRSFLARGARGKHQQ